MKISEIPLYSVLGLDLAVTETDLVIGNDHFNIIDLFQTHDAEEAMQKLEEFNTAYPKAVVINNAALASSNLECQVNEMKNKLPSLVNEDAQNATSN